MTPNPEIALQEAIAADREYTPRETFWASSLNKCPRALVSERAGIAPTNPPDTRSQFKMWTGTVMGKAIQEHLLKVGYLEQDWHEKRVTYRSFSGRVDGFTKHVNGGAIVEVKTSDDDAITKYPDMPEHYLIQGLWYCLAAGVNTLVLLQFGKNQGLSRHRVYTLDAKWTTRLEALMTSAEQYWELYQHRHELPEHFHTYTWEDKYCPYLEDDLTDIVKRSTTQEVVKT